MTLRGTIDFGSSWQKTFFSRIKVNWQLLAIDQNSNEYKHIVD